MVSCRRRRKPVASALAVVGASHVVGASLGASHTGIVEANGGAGAGHSCVGTSHRRVVGAGHGGVDAGHSGTGTGTMRGSGVISWRPVPVPGQCHGFAAAQMGTADLRACVYSASPAGILGMLSTSCLASSPSRCEGFGLGAAAARGPLPRGILPSDCAS